MNYCISRNVLTVLVICYDCQRINFIIIICLRHFEETNHTYAMQLDNKRVWDYAGDNYVHRIIQSKGDGKLVEFNEGRNTEDEEKLDSITLEVGAYTSVFHPQGIMVTSVCLLPLR